MTADILYQQPQRYDDALPRYEFAGVSDEQLLQAELDRLGGTRVRHALEIGCGTGRMTRVLRPYTDRLTCLDTSAPMIQALSAGQPDVTRIKADVRDYLADTSGTPFDLVSAFWSLNYPLLSCFETNSGDQIVQRDLTDAQRDADTFLTDLTDALAPRGWLLAFFFDPDSAEQRFITNLWETVAPFPGTGRDFTRRLLIDHLHAAPGTVDVTYHDGQMIATDRDHALRWFLDGHLKGFPRLVDDPRTCSDVQTFLTGHEDADGAVRVPTGLYVISYRHER